MGNNTVCVLLPILLNGLNFKNKRILFIISERAIKKKKTDCLCPPKICMLNLTPNVMIFGGKAFGKQLVHEGRALVNRISPFIGEVSEGYFISSTM